jgi:hypothetical protein
MLAVYGRPGDAQASLSAYDVKRGSKALVDEINAELRRLPRGQHKQETHSAAVEVLRRHGFGEPNRAGWYELPR